MDALTVLWCGPHQVSMLSALRAASRVAQVIHGTTCFRYCDGGERILMVSRRGEIIGIYKQSFIGLEHCNQLTFVVRVLVLRASKKKKKGNAMLHAGLHGYKSYT